MIFAYFRTFNFDVFGYVNYPTPLNLQTFLLQCCKNYNYPDWRILSLDWTNGSCQLGTESFSYEIPQRKPLIDRAGLCSNNTFKFVLYGLEEIGGTKIGCLPCIADVQRRKIQQIGADFQLPSELFHCLDLNGSVISGLSTSLDTITQFDLESRVILTTSQVHGLPPTICLFLQGTSFKLDFGEKLTSCLEICYLFYST
jgi:hypothetical protein